MFNLDTGVRPYTCGLCRDTFSRSDILKRHFQKCSARRGNPTGENHLSHSRANKKAEQQKEASSKEHEATPTDSSQPPSAYSTNGASTFDAALDLRALELGHASFGDSQRPSVTSMSRSNSVQKHKSSRNSSHRGSLGNAPTSSYDPAMPYTNGHVTPDSITTSGAATPYTYPQESRSNQISPDGPISRAANGISLGLPAASRPTAPNHYSTGSLPHIVGQTNGRGTDLDWQSYSGLTQDDFSNSQYNVGPMTGHSQVKQEIDFSGLNQNMFNFNK